MVEQKRRLDSINVDNAEKNRLEENPANVSHLEEKTQKIKKPKNKWMIASIVLGVLLIVSLFTTTSTDTSAKDKEISDLQAQVDELTEESETLAAQVEEAAPWFEMTEAEQAAAEEAAAAAAAAEEAEKVGYDTGITYDQLARTPDDYLYDEKVKFTGKVIQVMEGEDEVDLRIAVGGDYDEVILAAYDPSIVSFRVLEDDTITIYGISGGLYTYESTMGGNITVPIIAVEKIDQ